MSRSVFNPKSYPTWTSLFSVEALIQFISWNILEAEPLETFLVKLSENVQAKYPPCSFELQWATFGILLENGHLAWSLATHPVLIMLYGNLAVSQFWAIMEQRVSSSPPHYLSLSCLPLMWIGPEWKRQAVGINKGKRTSVAQVSQLVMLLPDTNWFGFS